MNYYQAIDELRKIKGLSGYDYTAEEREIYSPLSRMRLGIAEENNRYLVGSVKLSGVSNGGVEVTVTVYLNELEDNNGSKIAEIKRIFEG